MSNNLPQNIELTDTTQFCMSVPVDHVSCDMSLLVGPKAAACVCTGRVPPNNHERTLSPPSFILAAPADSHLTKPQAQPQEALELPERLSGATARSLPSSADSQRPPTTLQPLPLTSLRPQQGVRFSLLPQSTSAVVMPGTQSPSPEPVAWQRSFVDEDDPYPSSEPIDMDFSELDESEVEEDDTDTESSGSYSSDWAERFHEPDPVAESETEINISEPANLESVDTLVGDGDADRLSFSDFDLHDADYEFKTLAEMLVTNFNEIKPYMAPILASHLAKAVVNIWKKCTTEGIEETLDDMAARLGGDGTMTQELYYPYWFFVATQAITYPKDIPLHHQIRMYFGISPDADDPETMAKLAQYLKTLIETSPVTQLTDMATLQLPASGKSDQDIEQVRKIAENARDSLRGTLVNSRLNREQLEETRKELKKSREEHKRTHDQLKRTQQELKQTRIELDALTQAHAETKDKAERALRVSAMLLGSHLTPNSNKRKRGSDDEEL
ncbi:hypothetical protein FALBO_5927 [Fusarium albosuccineum]|uniref:Uncharacterized protein n=1 Tax=Fusarium albosuccineum TaxID=1237068 RepID=A0A8H4LFJ6_9HYPO|nr:hypothetical protein FALBO_5927 [Fusarium albosuccineum]